MNAATIVRIESIEDIPNSNKKKVWLAANGEKAIVVTGDHYQVGQPGFYVPDGGILPEKLLREMWLWNEELGKGRLAGKNGDRVKTRVMDGVPSSGVFYGAYYFHNGERIDSPSWNNDWQEGQDVAQELGITFK